MTNEATPTSFNDFSFVSITQGGATVLADTFFPLFWNALGADKPEERTTWAHYGRCQACTETLFV